MKTSIFVRVALLFLITSTLSGCIWFVEDDGFGHRGGRGGYHGERHGDRGGHY